MRVRKAYPTTHPIGFPWQWEAAGLVGYCMTRMGARSRLAMRWSPRCFVTKVEEAERLDRAVNDRLHDGYEKPLLNGATEGED